MARCKLTKMNLRNIRKTREYQALLIDFVSTGVVSKSVAEGLLGYTIPAGLLAADYTEPDDDEEEGGSGTEGSGSGTEGSGNTVTLLYYSPGDARTDPEWLTAEYDLTDDPTGEGIIAFAKDAFNDDGIYRYSVIEANPEYVEDESMLTMKYENVDPQPEIIEPGMLIQPTSER